MPALSACTTGCGTLTARGRCRECELDARREIDRRRPNARQRGYDRAWERTSAAYLAAHPRCECDDCTERLFYFRPLAKQVDHIDGRGPSGPRGHDWTNLRAMAASCHSRRTARDQPAGWNRQEP